MENLTIKDIATTLAILVSLIGSLIFLYNKIKAVIKKSLESEFNSINKNITELKEDLKLEIRELDENQCKNFLVGCIQDLKNGEKLSNETNIRLCEVYHRYSDKLHLNSYIHHSLYRYVEEYEKGGKIDEQ